MIDIVRNLTGVCELYVVAFTPPGDAEQIACVRDRGGAWLPLLTSTADRMRNLIPIAQRLVNERGGRFRILHFTGREDVTHLF